MDPGLVSFSFWSPFVSSFTRQGRDFFPWHLIPHARVASYTAFPSTFSGIPHPLFIQYFWYRICTFEHHSRWILRSFSFVHIIFPLSPPACTLSATAIPIFILLVYHFFSTYLSLHLHIPVMALSTALISCIISSPPQRSGLDPALYTLVIYLRLWPLCHAHIYILLHTYTLNLLKTLYWDLILLAFRRVHCFNTSSRFLSN